MNTGYDSPAQQSLATVRGKLRPFFLEQVFFFHLVLLLVLVLPLNLLLLRAAPRQRPHVSVGGHGALLASKVSRGWRRL